MNLKETSRTGLQLFTAASLRNLFRAPAASSRPAPMLFSFQRSLPASASQFRVSAQPFCFSRPLLRGGPALYLVSIPPSRTFLFFLSGVFSPPQNSLGLFSSLRFVPAATRQEYTAFTPQRSRTFFQLQAFFSRAWSHACGCSSHLLKVSMILRACSALEILNFDLARYCPSLFW
jgi:hypothetical protein